MDILFHISRVVAIEINMTLLCNMISGEEVLSKTMVTNKGKAKGLLYNFAYLIDKTSFLISCQGLYHKLTPRSIEFPFFKYIFKEKEELYQCKIQIKDNKTKLSRKKYKKQTLDQIKEDY